MKKNFNLLVVLLVTLSLNSCKKSDTEISKDTQDITNNFFKLRTELKPEVKRVYDYFKDLNSKNEFIIKFVKNEGYLDWDKAVVSKKQEIYKTETINSTPTFVEIPLLVQSGEFAKGFLVAKETQTIELLLVNGEKFKSLSYGELSDNSLNAEDLALKLMLMNKELYGISTFSFKDKLLFDKFLPLNVRNLANETATEIKIDNVQSQTTSTYGRFVSYTTYVTYYTWNSHCTHTGSCASGTCDHCSLCGEWVPNHIPVTVTSYIEPADDWGTYGGGGDTGGGGAADPASTYNQNCDDLGDAINIFKPCDPKNLLFYPVDQVKAELTALAGTKDGFDILPLGAFTTGNAQSFNSVDEFKDYLDYVQNNQTFDYDPSAFQQVNGEPVDKQRVVYNYPFMPSQGIDISVKCEKDPSNPNVFKVKEVTTSEYGLWICANFEQTSFGWTPPTPSKPNEIVIDVYGNINYNLIIKGIATVYHQSKHYQLTIDNKTGKITSAKEI